MTYRSDSALGSTDLKNILNSPRAFLDGRQKPRKPSAAMELGTLSHVLLLEPETYQDKYAIFATEEKVNTKLYKAVKADFISKNKDKIIIKQETYDQAKVVIESFSSAPALERCEKEKPFFCEADVNGTPIKLKALCDAVDTEKHIIFDFKTIRDVEAWPYNLEKFKYYLQDYHYRYVYASSQGIPIEQVKFVFLVADSTTGYSFITVLDEETKIAAEAEHRHALKTFKSFCYNKNLTQDEIINYPAEQEPAFNLKSIIQSGLKPFAINRILNTTNEGE